MKVINDRELEMERIFNAPRELVFEAYSKAEHLENWWGPKGWSLPVCELDFRPGGTWLYCMEGPIGSEDGELMQSWGKATYEKIVAPEQIVYKDTFVDSEGNRLDNTPEMLITIRFVEEDGKTKLISTTRFETAEELQTVLNMGVEEGFNETLDRLETYLKTIG